MVAITSMIRSDGYPIHVLVRISATGSVSTHKVSGLSKCAAGDATAVSGITNGKTGAPLIIASSNGSVVPRIRIRRGIAEPGIGAPNTKMCRRCHQRKSRSEFYCRWTEKDDLVDTCVLCTRLITPARHAYKKEPLEKKNWISDCLEELSPLADESEQEHGSCERNRTLTCDKCKQKKSLTHFSFFANEKHPRGVCLACKSVSGCASHEEQVSVFLHRGGTEVLVSTQNQYDSGAIDAHKIMECIKCKLYCLPSSMHSSGMCLDCQSVSSCSTLDESMTEIIRKEGAEDENGDPCEVCAADAAKAACIISYRGHGKRGTQYMFSGKSSRIPSSYWKLELASSEGDELLVIRDAYLKLRRECELVQVIVDSDIGVTSTGGVMDCIVLVCFKTTITKRLVIDMVERCLSRKENIIDITPIHNWEQEVYIACKPNRRRKLSSPQT